MDDDRLISRQAAIETVKKHYRGIDNDLLEIIAYEMEELPPTQPSATDTNVGGTNDTISRQAILDAVDGVDWYHQNKDGEMVHGANSDEHQAWYKADDIYKAIESVPPVTPKQPGWIPCSTALPKQDGDYLVTKKSFGWNCTEYIETDIARYEKKDGWHKADTVLAWCELPTPYREGGRDGV